MIFLVFYDITDNKIRTKISKQLIANGYERLQYSVFTGLEHPAHNKLLWEQLQKLLQPEPEAKFYVIPVTRHNFKSIKIIGNFDIDIEYLTGEKRSLTF